MNCRKEKMIRYDLRREPQIGTLSEMSPYTILNDQGSATVAWIDCIWPGSSSKCVLNMSMVARPTITLEP